MKRSKIYFKLSFLALAFVALINAADADQAGACARGEVLVESAFFPGTFSEKKVVEREAPRKAKKKVSWDEDGIRLREIVGPHGESTHFRDLPYLDFREVNEHNRELTTYRKDPRYKSGTHRNKKTAGGAYRWTEEQAAADSAARFAAYGYAPDEALRKAQDRARSDDYGLLKFLGRLELAETKSQTKDYEVVKELMLPRETVLGDHYRRLIAAYTIALTAWNDANSKMAQAGMGYENKQAFYEAVKNAQAKSDELHEVKESFIAKKAQEKHPLKPEETKELLLLLLENEEDELLDTRRWPEMAYVQMKRLEERTK